MTTADTSLAAAPSRAPAVVEGPRLDGKIAVVTGGSSGIGGEISRQLAALGATVVTVGRSQEKGLAFTAGLRGATGNKTHDFLASDMSSQTAVRSLAQELQRRYPRIDILVNNVGGAFFKRGVTVDGMEQTLALNLLTPFLLTQLLLPTLKQTRGAKVINVATKLTDGTKIDFDDLQAERKYSAFGTYGRAKLGLMLFSVELARRLEGSGVQVAYVHPGVAPETDFGVGMPKMIRALSPFITKLMGIHVTLEQAGDTAVHLAARPALEGPNGSYFIRRKLADPPPQVRDAEVAKRLWDACESLTRLRA
ncbi:MAG TPA: SDR family NAD(P)-dependent oxidoreductase [Myxococcaceae bacterium]|jgi:NAD(P)-dependent dehydrogenase (short-subunit alcohol dehydrogenase family)